jgi:hypothetical protein
VTLHLRWKANSTLLVLHLCKTWIHCVGFVWLLGAFAIAISDYYLHVFLALSAWTNSFPTGRIFMKFNILGFFENLSSKFTFYINLKILTGTLYEDQCIFMTISRWILLGMTNVSDKLCREDTKTHFTLNFFPPRKSWRCWDNVVNYGTARQATGSNTLRRVRFAC